MALELLSCEAGPMTCNAWLHEVLIIQGIIKLIVIQPSRTPAPSNIERLLLAGSCIYTQSRSALCNLTHAAQAQDMVALRDCSACSWLPCMFVLHA